MSEYQPPASEQGRVTADGQVQGMGDAWTDRIYAEWPRMKGFEVSEEEYQEWMKKEGYET